MYDENDPNVQLRRIEPFPLSMTFIRHGDGKAREFMNDLIRDAAPFDLIMTSYANAAMNEAERIAQGSTLRPFVNARPALYFANGSRFTRVCDVMGEDERTALTRQAHEAALLVKQTAQKTNALHVLVLAESPLIQAIGMHFYETDNRLSEIALAPGEGFRIALTEEILRDGAESARVEMIRAW